MATDVYGAIGLYLKEIHTKLVWRTLVGTHSQPRRGRRPAADDSRPDLLLSFSKVMMETHAKATLLLELPVPCNNTDECRQNEECIKGVCTPVPSIAEMSTEFLRPCNNTDECRQNEECINGFCTPVAIEPIYVDRTTKVPVPMEAGLVLEDYWARIHAIIARVVAEKPARLVAVRDLLMEAYADAAKLAGARLTDCRAGIDCKEDEVCVNGVCVPIPFRLGFRRPGSPRPAPWS